MPNLRVINTILSNSATLSATEEAGDLLVTNLQTDTKSEVWRSTTLNPIITCLLSASAFVSAVSFPFSNFSATATVRVKMYTLSSDTVPVYDSGNVLCCASGSLSNLASGVNSLAYGAGVYATVFCSRHACEKVTIEIIDNNNPSGYVESGKLVVGDYWEAEVNADYGAKLTFSDLSDSVRTDGGDLYSDRKTRHKSLQLSLSHMSTSDRDNLVNLQLNNGKVAPFYISIFPESLNIKEEQMYQIFGKLIDVDSVTRAFYNRDKSGISVEEI